tara:strand:+ start:86 stop:574 length:489 start_codon:yes stop_codon:yes gene_type:complete
MSNVNFRSLVKAYSTSVDKAGKNLTTLVDYMVAEGVSIKLLKDKKSDISADMDAGIVASFDKPTQRLLQSETKGLSAKNKMAKRYGQQQIGSRRAKIIKALDARINPVEQGPDQKKTDDQTFCQEKITQVKKRAEKSENMSCDVVELLAKLNELQEILNTKI